MRAQMKQAMATRSRQQMYLTASELKWGRGEGRCSMLRISWPLAVWAPVRQTSARAPGQPSGASTCSPSTLSHPY